jgi:hypothetical protein
MPARLEPRRASTASPGRHGHAGQFPRRGLQVGGSRTLASRILGVDRKTLYRKLGRRNAGPAEDKNEKSST